MEHYILVVDDDPGILDCIEQTLALEGYAVRTAAHGEAALACIAAAPPAVILTDLAMPVMDGWQLLQALRAQGVAAPIVFMSAGTRVAEEADRHAADGYIAKPFELDELVRVVQRTATVDADD
jgi:CheY-like chemotaxis protein